MLVGRTRSKVAARAMRFIVIRRIRLSFCILSEWVAGGAIRGARCGFYVISASGGGYGTLIEEHESFDGDSEKSEGVAACLGVAVGADSVRAGGGSDAVVEPVGAAAGSGAEYREAAGWGDGASGLFRERCRLSLDEAIDRGLKRQPADAAGRPERADGAWRAVDCGEQSAAQSDG